jgi:hypothetical protein
VGWGLLRSAGPLRLFEVVFDGVLAAVALVVTGLVVALEAGHASDRYRLDDGTAGIWLALVKNLEHGILFPALFDGRFYGGTRYMPLPLAAVALVNQPVGNLVLAAKLTAYVFAAAFFLLLFRIIRRQGCSAVGAGFLTAAVLLTNTGLLAATGLRFDSLAGFLQLSALAVAERARQPRALAAAGGLCTLAIMSKFNALWAAAAILVWLAVKAPRRLWVFVSAFAGSLGLALLVVQLSSQNRFLSEVRALSFAGYQGSLGEGNSASTLQNGLLRLEQYARADARAAVWLLPFALLALFLAAYRRTLTIYQVAFLCSLPLRSSRIAIKASVRTICSNRPL